jgi:hypothetical protein
VVLSDAHTFGCSICPSFTNCSTKCLSHVDVVTPAAVYGFIQDSVSDPAYAAAMPTTAASMPSDGSVDQSKPV